MTSPAQSGPTPSAEPRDRVELAIVELTPEQRAARLELLALIRRHNPAPSQAALEAIEREWLED